ncbi:MAG: phosphopyruvate hydratase [Mollicutes bacterium]|nr:phosphopyruvate hydratase [Mollicutes bacterium]
MSKIINIKAREILDSRGNPTVEVEVTTEKGIKAVAAVPSGASTGSREALELRDNDERYCGKGVLKAVNNVNTLIKDAILGFDVSQIKEIDTKMIEIDGTTNKSKLGANATLGVSLACVKAAALEAGKEVYEYLNPREKKIPRLMFNIVNGGMHAKNNIDIQEFMIVPKRESFKEDLRCASEVFHALKKLLDNEGLATSVGDEGGFAPNLETNKTALNYIVKAIETAGYVPAKDVFIALDVAASSLYNEATKTYKIEDKFLNKEELLDYYLDLVKNYPIISIEDPYDENDYEGFKLITDRLGKEINIVGDDLFVTNKKELEHGIENGLCNSILIKPNQIGTFYEMLETIVLAKKNNYTCIMSHRSGETTDTFIIDAAVALNIPFVKTGSVSRGERICKFNRLLKIEEEIEEKN